MRTDLMRQAYREALAISAALGNELGYTLRAYKELDCRRVRMLLQRGGTGIQPRIVVEVYPERCKRPRSLLMYVEVLPSGALPNRFVYDKSIGGTLIRGNNRCWNVEPTRDDKTRFDLKRCVVRSIEDALRPRTW